MTPRLLGWLRTGDRGYSGLYRVFTSNPGFALDLWDSDKATALCCSEGYVRYHLTWNNGKFLQSGPLEYGKVEDQPKPDQPRPRNQTNDRD